jgi:hypothetical protein
MNWQRLAFAALGVASGIVGAFVPVAAPVLFPIATGLIGYSVRAPGDAAKLSAAPKKP